MDDQAGRLSMAGLRALTRCREARERQALAELRARLAMLDSATAAGEALREDLERQEAGRRGREAAMYAAMVGRPLSVGQLDGYRSTMARLGDGVEEIAGRLAQAESERSTAERRAERARAIFQDRLRQSHKSRRIEDKAVSLRRRRLEALEEWTAEEIAADGLAARQGGGS